MSDDEIKEQMNRVRQAYAKLLTTLALFKAKQVNEEIRE